MVIEHMRGAYQSLFRFLEKFAKHQMANICAITIPPVPITHVMSKDTLIYPLVDLCDERRSTWCGMMWMQFHVSREIWQNVIIIKPKGIKDYAKVA